MTLKDTINQMHHDLEQMNRDLHKAVKGNKAASQRVRTISVKFAKLAKLYRKESIASERGIKKIRKSVKKKIAKKARRKKR